MVKDILVDNKYIYNFEYFFLKYFSLVTKASIFLLAIGFFQKKPTIIVEINSVVKILIGLFLVYRFNSYRKYKIRFTDLDRKVCYSAGLYIILITFGEYLLKFADDIKQYFYSLYLNIIGTGNTNSNNSNNNKM